MGIKLPATAFKYKLTLSELLTHISCASPLDGTQTTIKSANSLHDCEANIFYLALSELSHAQVASGVALRNTQRQLITARPSASSATVQVRRLEHVRINMQQAQNKHGK